MFSMVVLSSFVFFSFQLSAETEKTISDNSIDNEELLAEIANSPKLCGPNGLYLLLRLEEEAIEYGQVLDITPADINGTSLLSLRESTDKLGLGYEIYEISEEQAVSSDRPFLAYLHPTDDESQLGHFVVVTGFESETERIVTIDGITGRVFPYDKTKFFNLWSGHVLMRERSSSHSILLFPVVLGFLAILFFSCRA